MEGIDNGSLKMANLIKHDQEEILLACANQIQKK